jgi:hypothetical protein
LERSAASTLSRNEVRRSIDIDFKAIVVSPETFKKNGIIGDTIIGATRSTMLEKVEGTKEVFSASPITSRSHWLANVTFSCRDRACSET